ncbi:hypothetical protein Q4Q35_15350 [Flavivirga aquimarina]|uniref:POTRA domain-containing protein n=1 Tax=Flavivirga aquimarina TaxID=2027862 RepID=A0ABT8WDS7_9FLAO|nr:hypothetical protein [Flavivirga aquimarina]MDO5971184.1 hypothetical protein [Flavivirga aquimarina]
MKIRYFLGITFLLFQVLLIIYARFVPERFFCWAPYDQHTQMEVEVVINNKKLTKKEIQERYHYRSIGWEKRSINNVFDIIKQYESTYGLNDNAKVVVKYSINGQKQQIWTLK